ncbi:MAG: cupin domain-containing protein [Paracoccaceae bacterium]|tara:strand:+ start:179 stop:553 length:375 start_codon:yes stop_codon:yes gene_type:complete
MDNKKIMQLNPHDLEAVKLSAVEDRPFMQVIASDKPVAGGMSSFQSSDGKLDVGFYHGSEVTLQINGWPVDEVMIFLEGQVEITNQDGLSRIYGPGEMLVMPKGFIGTWRQIGSIKKLNVSYQG